MNKNKIHLLESPFTPSSSEEESGKEVGTGATHGTMSPMTNHPSRVGWESIRKRTRGTDRDDLSVETPVGGKTGVSCVGGSPVQERSEPDASSV